MAKRQRRETETFYRRDSIFLKMSQDSARRIYPRLYAIFMRFRVHLKLGNGLSRLRVRVSAADRGPPSRSGTDDAAPPAVELARRGGARLSVSGFRRITRRGYGRPSDSGTRSTGR